MENKEPKSHVSKIPKRNQLVLKVKSQNNLKIPESQAKLRKGVSFKSEGPIKPEQSPASLKSIPDQNMNRKGILKTNKTSISKIPLRVKQNNTADLLKQISMEDLKKFMEKLSHDDLQKLAKEHGVKQVSKKRYPQVKAPMKTKYIAKTDTAIKDVEAKVTKGRFWKFTSKFTKKTLAGDKKRDSFKDLDNFSDKNAVKGLLDDVISRDDNIQSHECNSTDITDLSIDTRSSDSFKSKTIHIHRSSSDFDFMKQSKRKRRREVSLTPESNSLDDRISNIRRPRSRSASNVNSSPSTTTSSSQKSYESSRKPYRSRIPIRKLSSLDSFSIDSDTDSETKSPSLDSRSTIKPMKYSSDDIPSPTKDSLDYSNRPFNGSHDSLKPSIYSPTPKFPSKHSLDDITLPSRGSRDSLNLPTTDYRDGKIPTGYSPVSMKSSLGYSHDGVNLIGGSHGSIKITPKYGYGSPNLHPSNSYSDRDSFSPLRTQNYGYDRTDDRPNLRSTTIRPSRSSVDLRRPPTGSRYSGLETYEREPLSKNYEDELASIGPSSVSPHKSITDLRHASSNTVIPPPTHRPHLDVTSDRLTAKRSRHTLKDTCTLSQTDLIKASLMGNDDLTSKKHNVKQERRHFRSSASNTDVLNLRPETKPENEHKKEMKSKPQQPETNERKKIEYDRNKSTNDKSKKKVKFLIDGLISLLHDVNGVEKRRRQNSVKGFKYTDKVENFAEVTEIDFHNEVSSKIDSLLDNIILILNNEEDQNEIAREKTLQAKELKRKLSASLTENKKTNLMMLLDDAINLLHGIVSIDNISKLKKAQSNINTDKITKEPKVKKTQPIKEHHKIDIKKKKKTETSRDRSKVKIPKSDPVDEILNLVDETTPVVDETANLLDDTDLAVDEALTEVDETFEGDITETDIDQTVLEVVELPEGDILSEIETTPYVEIEPEVEVEPEIEAVAEIDTIFNVDETVDEIQETENIVQESIPDVDQLNANEVPSNTVLGEGVKSEDLSEITPSNMSANMNSEEMNELNVEEHARQHKIKRVSKSVANLKPSLKKSNHNQNDSDKNISIRPKSVLKRPVKTDGETLKDLLCKLRNNSNSSLTLSNIDIEKKDELKSILDVIDLDYSEIKKINDLLQLLLKSVEEDINNKEAISDTGLKVVRETKSLFNLKGLGHINEQYKKRDKVLENEILQKYLTESDDSVEILSRFYEATNRFNNMSKKPLSILKKKASAASLNSVKTTLSADQVKVDRQSSGGKDTFDIQSKQSDQSVKSNKRSLRTNVKKRHSTIAFKNDTDSAYSGESSKSQSSKLSKLRFSIKNLKQRRASTRGKGLRPQIPKFVTPPIVEVTPPFLAVSGSKSLNKLEKKASDILQCGSHTESGFRGSKILKNKKVRLDDEKNEMINELNEEYIKPIGEDKLNKKKSTSSIKGKKIEKSASLEKYLKENVKIDKKAQKIFLKRAEKEKKSKEELKKKLEAQIKKSADKISKKESAVAKSKSSSLNEDTDKSDVDLTSSAKNSEMIICTDNASDISINNLGETDKSDKTLPQEGDAGSIKSKDSADKDNGLTKSKDTVISTGQKKFDPSIIVYKPSKERTEVTKLDTSSKVRRNPKGRIEEIISITYLKTRGTQYDVSHVTCDNDPNKIENPTKEAAPVEKEASLITLRSSDNTPSSPDPDKAFAIEKANQGKGKATKKGKQLKKLSEKKMQKEGTDVPEQDAKQTGKPKEGESSGLAAVNETGNQGDNAKATDDAAIPITDNAKGTVEEKPPPHTEIVYDPPNPKQARRRNKFSKDQLYRELHDVKDGEDKGTETKMKHSSSDRHRQRHRRHGSRHRKHSNGSRHREHSKLSMISEEPRRPSRHRGSQRNMRRYSQMHGDGGGDDIIKIFESMSSGSSSSDLMSASSSYSSHGSHCKCFRSAEFLLKRRCCEQQYIYGNNNSCFTKLIRGLCIIIHRVADIFMCCFPGDCRRKRCF